jgi:hypothetical protein
MDGQRKNRGGPLYWLSRRSRRFWFAAVAMLPALYIASFGPACYLTSRSAISTKSVWMVFRPLIWLGVHGPDTLSRGIIAYAELCYAEDTSKLGGRMWETPFEYESLSSSGF